jgi:hypothetical protein
MNKKVRKNKAFLNFRLLPMQNQGSCSVQTVFSTTFLKMKHNPSTTITLSLNGGLKVNFFLCYNGTFVLKINHVGMQKILFSMKIRGFCEILFFIQVNNQYLADPIFTMMDNRFRNLKKKN